MSTPKKHIHEDSVDLYNQGKGFEYELAIACIYKAVMRFITY